MPWGGLGRGVFYAQFAISTSTTDLLDWKQPAQIPCQACCPQLLFVVDFT